jgi:hypothetical protein
MQPISRGVHHNEKKREDKIKAVTLRQVLDDCLDEDRSSGVGGVICIKVMANGAGAERYVPK